MKLPLVLLGSLAVGVLLQGQTTTSTQQPPTDPKSETTKKTTTTDKAKTAPGAQTAPTTKATTPATKSSTAKTDKTSPKKEEPPAKIEGMEIARGGEKGFLGLQVVSGMFKLSFFDAKKKPVNPDVLRAALRWDPKNKIGSERVILNQEGKALAAGKFIQPPYAFKLFITLFKESPDGGEPIASENYVVDFSQ